MLADAEAVIAGRAGEADAAQATCRRGEADFARYDLQAVVAHAIPRVWAHGRGARHPSLRGNYVCDQVRNYVSVRPVQLGNP
jgi:hypothetical protein